MSGCSMDLAYSILGVQHLLVYGLPPPFVPMRPRPTRCSSLAARPISPPTTVLLSAAVTENPLFVVEPTSASLHSFLGFAISANLAHSQIFTYIYLPPFRLSSLHNRVLLLLNLLLLLQLAYLACLRRVLYTYFSLLLCIR